MLIRSLVACLALTLTLVPCLAADPDSDLGAFQGKWVVVELAENGHVIPREAIPQWLPSGGKVEIADNAIMITTPSDGKKSVKIFELSGTQYPRAIDIMTREKKEAVGIYRFDEGRLVICLTDPEAGQRPTEFSAESGSNQMLMVLQRPLPKKPTTAATATPPRHEVLTGLTDQDVRRMLIGTWRYHDKAGALDVTFSSDGTWSTVRESEELRLFKKVFVRTPVSSGTWTVKGGAIQFLCTASVHLSRVNTSHTFVLRSISEKDMIFVDFAGRLGRADRVR